MKKTASTGAFVRNPVYLLLVIVSTALTAGAVFYPLFIKWGYLPHALLAKLCYTPLCHQIQERSFHLFGYPLAVCERCFSMYTGFTVVVWLYPFLRRFVRESNVILVSAVLCFPMVFDWTLDHFGLLSNSMTSRSLTGLLGGAGIGYIAVPALLEVARGAIRKKTQPVND